MLNKELMEIQGELFIALKILLAGVAGGFIGFDRERHGLDAGIRTYATVCLGATLFTVLGEHLEDTSAISRVISNIIVGIGFLGAGVIYKDHSSSSSNSKGLTSAASIWCTAAVGVAIGLDKYVLVVVALGSLFFLLSLDHQKWYVRWKERIKVEGLEHVKEVNSTKQVGDDSHQPMVNTGNEEKK